jgi:hypothetical protein
MIRRASAWGEDHGIDHASLRDIDEEIQRWVPAVLAQELEQFEIYHCDGILSDKRNSCQICRPSSIVAMKLIIKDYNVYMKVVLY